MKNLCLILTAAALITGTAWAAPKKSVDLATKVKNLSTEALSADITKKVTRVSEGICGAEGPSYLVEVQVRHYDKELNRESGMVDLVSHFETIKIYGISEFELATQSAPVLMDSETCLE